MKDIIFTVLTSQGCGHCHNMRGNGDLGNGKQFTQYDFLKTHLDPLQNGNTCTILNIHYASMSGKREEIVNISKVYLRKDIIYQEKYYNNKEVTVRILSLDKNNTVTKIGEKAATVKEDWLTFVAKKVPRSLENYTFFFPCFIVFEKKNWKEGKNILGLTNAGYTMRDKNGNYMLEKDGRTLGERNVLPQKLITEAISGVSEFKAHKDHFELVKKEEPKKEEPKKEEPKKEEPKKEEPKKEEPKRSCCGFVVRNYDDE